MPEKRTHDRFVICDHTGRKIEKHGAGAFDAGGSDDRTVHAGFVTEAPDPAKAMHHFDQFLDKLVELDNETLYDRTLSLLPRSERMTDWLDCWAQATTSGITF